MYWLKDVSILDYLCVSVYYFCYYNILNVRVLFSKHRNLHYYNIILPYIIFCYFILAFHYICYFHVIILKLTYLSIHIIHWIFFIYFVKFIMYLLVLILTKLITFLTSFYTINIFVALTMYIFFLCSTISTRYTNQGTSR